MKEENGTGDSEMTLSVAKPFGGGQFHFHLNNALEKCALEFSKFKSDIIQSFADDDGRIETSLPLENFCRQLYSVTENISKTEIQVVAMRFCDNMVEAVTIPEFLEFFVTPEQVRSFSDLFVLHHIDQSSNMYFHRQEVQRQHPVQYG